tara:strand:+ start:168 stop:446 length:279 start_codon:yes stop_codon:yes gene_type:complete
MNCTTPNQFSETWLIDMQIRDGEFEYGSHYILDVGTTKGARGAWLHFKKEHDYLEFTDEESGIAEDGSHRIFEIGITAIPKKHIDIVRKYLY